MIFRIHIAKDSEQLNLASKIRTLLNIHDVYSSTYIPKDAQIGIKLHKVPSQELLSQIFGLIQRGGYEIEQLAQANAIGDVSSSQTKKKIT